MEQTLVDVILPSAYLKADFLSDVFRSEVFLTCNRLAPECAVKPFCSHIPQHEFLDNIPLVSNRKRMWVHRDFFTVPQIDSNS